MPQDPPLFKLMVTSKNQVTSAFKMTKAFNNILDFIKLRGSRGTRPHGGHDSLPDAMRKGRVCPMKCWWPLFLVGISNALDTKYVDINELVGQHLCEGVTRRAANTALITTYILGLGVFIGVVALLRRCTCRCRVIAAPPLLVGVKAYRKFVMCLIVLRTVCSLKFEPDPGRGFVGMFLKNDTFTDLELLQPYESSSSYILATTAFIEFYKDKGEHNCKILGRNETCFSNFLASYRDYGTLTGPPWVMHNTDDYKELIAEIVRMCNGSLDCFKKSSVEVLFYGGLIQEGLMESRQWWKSPVGKFVETLRELRTTVIVEWQSGVRGKYTTTLTRMGLHVTAGFMSYCRMVKEFLSAGVNAAGMGFKVASSGWSKILYLFHLGNALRVVNSKIEEDPFLQIKMLYYKIAKPIIFCERVITFLLAINPRRILIYVWVLMQFRKVKIVYSNINMPRRIDWLRIRLWWCFVGPAYFLTIIFNSWVCLAAGVFVHFLALYAIYDGYEGLRKAVKFFFFDDTDYVDLLLRDQDSRPGTSTNTFFEQDLPPLLHPAPQENGNDHVQEQAPAQPVPNPGPGPGDAANAAHEELQQTQRIELPAANLSQADAARLRGRLAGDYAQRFYQIVTGRSVCSTFERLNNASIKISVVFSWKTFLNQGMDNFNFPYTLPAHVGGWVPTENSFPCSCFFDALFNALGAQFHSRAEQRAAIVLCGRSCAGWLARNVQRRGADGDLITSERLIRIFTSWYRDQGSASYCIPHMWIAASSIYNLRLNIRIDQGTEHGNLIINSGREGAVEVPLKLQEGHFYHRESDHVTYDAGFGGGAAQRKLMQFDGPLDAGNPRVSPPAINQENKDKAFNLLFFDVDEALKGRAVQTLGTSITTAHGPALRWDLLPVFPIRNRKGLKNRFKNEYERIKKHEGGFKRHPNRTNFELLVDHGTEYAEFRGKGFKSAFGCEPRGVLERPRHYPERIIPTYSNVAHTAHDLLPPGSRPQPIKDSIVSAIWAHSDNATKCLDLLQDIISWNGDIDSWDLEYGAMVLAAIGEGADDAALRQYVADCQHRANDEWDVIRAGLPHVPIVKAKGTPFRQGQLAEKLRRGAAVETTMELPDVGVKRQLHLTKAEDAEAMRFRRKIKEAEFKPDPSKLNQKNKIKIFTPDPSKLNRRSPPVKSYGPLDHGREDVRGIFSVGTKIDVTWGEVLLSRFGKFVKYRVPLELVWHAERAFSWDTPASVLEAGIRKCGRFNLTDKEMSECMAATVAIVQSHWDEQKRLHNEMRPSFFQKMVTGLICRI